MTPITDRQVLTLIEGANLLRAHADVLSDFEVEVVADVGGRFGRFKRDAQVSPEEWTVIEAAADAMRAAQILEARRRRAALEFTRIA